MPPSLRPDPPEYDVVVVGSGPNGLAGAVRCAEAGCSVLVLEAAPTPGGGTRTKELTLPGFRHDVCSAAHPMGVTSRVFGSMPLAAHGLRWIDAPIEAANPLDDGSAGVLLRDPAATDEANGSGTRWRRLLEPFVKHWPRVGDHLMGPVTSGLGAPDLLVRFGIRALVPASVIADRLGPRSGALFAGTAAHAIGPLTKPLSSPAGIMLAAAGHVGGWPVAQGGSQAIADALVAYLRTMGGTVVCDHPVRSLDDLPAARAYLFDTTPWQLLDIVGDRAPASAQKHWRRFRHGGGSFKIDYALSGPVPWTNEESRRAGTVHVGGTVAEITAAEADVAAGRVPERPFVLVAQQSLFDSTRAPDGQHTLWVYCHVPNGCTVDMTDRIEAQIERFAPGWRDLILARHTSTPAQLQSYNENYRGGDIAGGASDGFQVLFRPDRSLDPYRTPIPDVWLCSSSTPPGGGVHGICGDRAARSLLRHI